LQTYSEDGRSAITANHYNFNQLAALYNQSRVDYIVPMPMNGKRMAEYVQYYDVDLQSSFISLNQENQETGVGLLGVRGDRSWVTRLGVIPERRGKKVGQYLMELLLIESERLGIRRVQLEVIVGNDPAYQLFQKLGFREERELHVIRRPPSVPGPELEIPNAKIYELDETEIPDYLAQRDFEHLTWVDENASLLNTGSLRGYGVELPSGEDGWLIFQRTPFQMTHFAFSSNISERALQALLYSLHTEYSMQDTKIENHPVDSPLWYVFERMGYLEVFRRIEMYLYLNP
jgi:GNAT superfamily N-acetyltransferase